MFVIGRAPTGRASLMHEIDTERVHEDGARLTLCGRPLLGGSRAYLHDPIREVLCIRCTAARARRNREGRP